MYLCLVLIGIIGIVFGAIPNTSISENDINRGGIVQPVPTENPNTVSGETVQNGNPDVEVKPSEGQTDTEKKSTFSKRNLPTGGIKLYGDFLSGASKKMTEPYLANSRMKILKLDQPENMPAYQANILLNDSDKTVVLMFGGRSADDPEPVLMKVFVKLPYTIKAEDVIAKYLAEHPHAKHTRETETKKTEGEPAELEDGKYGIITSQIDQHTDVIRDGNFEATIISHEVCLTEQLLNTLSLDLMTDDIPVVAEIKTDGSIRIGENLSSTEKEELKTGLTLVYDELRQSLGPVLVVSDVAMTEALTAIKQRDLEKTKDAADEQLEKEKSEVLGF